MSKVIVVLDREDAVSSLYYALPEGMIPALRAALDRDPDALIEQVAEAIRVADLNIDARSEHEAFQCYARAALAAITGEGKD